MVEEKSKKPQGSNRIKGKLPTLSREMKELHKFLGTWRVRERQIPHVKIPDPPGGDGTAVVKAGPRGMSIIEDLHIKNADGDDYYGHGVYAWDPDRAAVRCVWVDGLSSGAQVSTCYWEGDSLVCIPEGPLAPMGIKMRGRTTIRKITERSRTVIGEAAVDRDRLSQIFELTYTKTRD